MSELNNRDGGDMIYRALVERASSGRMTEPITFDDLDAGLLGPEGREHAARVRAALRKAGISPDGSDPLDFIKVVG